MEKRSKVYTVGELASEVNRAPHTVRLWDRYEKLPKHLRAKRDDSGWRFWTQDQVDGIKTWLIEEDIRPGSGIIKKK